MQLEQNQSIVSLLNFIVNFELAILMNCSNFSGMYHSLRGDSGGNEPDARKCTLRAMPRSSDGEFTDFEHGQDYNCSECGDLYDDCHSGNHFPDSESSESKEAAHFERYRPDEDGRTDFESACELLFDCRSNAQSRWTDAFDGHSECLQCSEGVGPGFCVQ